MNYRKANPESEKQIYDCMYEELFSDPIATVKKIYQKFDLEYTTDFEERMITYLEQNKQGKYGRHKYSLKEYGFDAGDIFEEFQEYMDHYKYGIPEKFDRPASFDFLRANRQ